MTNPGYGYEYPGVPPSWQEFQTDTQLEQMVLSYDTMLSDTVASHNARSAYLVRGYAAEVARTSVNDVEDVLVGMSRRVGGDFAYTEAEVNRAIDEGARMLEDAISPSDMAVVRELRGIIRDPRGGIGSYYYQRTLEDVTNPTSRNAIQRIMNRDVRDHMRMAAEDPRHGLGSYWVDRIIEEATPAAQPALRASLDRMVLDETRADICDPDCGVGSYRVSCDVEYATPAAQPAIRASLDRYVLAAVRADAQNPYRGPDSYWVGNKLEDVSCDDVRDLIAEDVGYTVEDIVDDPSVFDVTDYDEYRLPASHRRVESRRPLRRVLQVAAAAAAIAVAAVSMKGHVLADSGTPASHGSNPSASGPLKPGPATAPSDEIGQCYTAAPQIPVSDTAPRPVTMPYKGDTVEHVPVFPSVAFEQRVSQDVVEITAAQGGNVLWKGSGFITTDAEGNQVVVTAGHVDGGMNADQLTITTSDGRHVHPEGGCYIWANNGQLQPFTQGSEQPVDSDIAVLALSQPLVHHPLGVATSDPAPGSTVDFQNYQGDYGPQHTLFSDDTLIGSQASYTGIVAPSHAGDPDLEVITGVNNVDGPYPSQQQFETTHLTPGGSGGPVIENGVVFGVSDASVAERGKPYISAGNLSNWYNISFPGVNIGEQSGIEPENAIVMRSWLIRKALAAPILRQLSR